MADEKKTGNKKLIFITVGVILILVLSALLGVSYEIDHYIDTHTWATVRVSGEIDSDTSDAFSEEHEYLKGDRISFGNVILDITDITHDGTVIFSVEQGELFNKAGETISSDELKKGVTSEYKLNNGTVYFMVTSNRYE